MEHLKISCGIGYIMIIKSDEGETTINPGYHKGVQSTYVNLLGEDLVNLHEYAKGNSSKFTVTKGAMTLVIEDTADGIEVDLLCNDESMDGKIITRPGFKERLLKV